MGAKVVFGSCSACIHAHARGMYDHVSYLRATFTLAWGQDRKCCLLSTPKRRPISSRHFVRSQVSRICRVHAHPATFRGVHPASSWAWMYILPAQHLTVCWLDSTQNPALFEIKISACGLCPPVMWYGDRWMDGGLSRRSKEKNEMCWMSDRRVIDEGKMTPQTPSVTSLH